jgi:hypothetical protein
MLRAAVAGDRVRFDDWREKLQAEPDAAALTQQELRICTGYLLHQSQQQCKGEFIPRVKEVLARAGLELNSLTAGDIQNAGVTLTVTARRALSCWVDPSFTIAVEMPDGLLAAPDAPEESAGNATTGAEDGGTNDGAVQETAVGTSSPSPAVKPKRSTERGEGRSKLIAALTMHHRYADGGCLNLAPIGNNDLARLAGVSPSTASAFFNEEFQGHAKYKALCPDSARLVAALKLLNNEYSPHDLYGRRPADEDDRDDG